MKRALAWVAGLAMVGLAALVGQLTLTDDQQQTPFVVRAEIGERAEARTFAVTISAVRLADRLEDSGGWSADAEWLVVELEAEATRTETASILSNVQVLLGDRRISASERPSSFDNVPLDVGLPMRGSFAFELPPGTLEAEAPGTATLQLGMDGEPRLDSLVELPIDLGSLEREAMVTVPETRWVGGR